MSQLGEVRRLVQFHGESDEVWKLMRPGCASLVFVDGEHSYDQVVADFEHYKNILAPGGCMVFHDTTDTVIIMAATNRIPKFDMTATSMLWPRRVSNRYSWPIRSLHFSRRNDSRVESCA